MSKLFLEDETYAIRGACFEVYKEKGSGFLEEVYQECLEIELEMQGIPFVAQPELIMTYKGKPIKKRYFPDFILYGQVILEIKAVEAIHEKHRAQILNYLHSTGFKVGLLVNFGHYPRVEIERFAL